MIEHEHNKKIDREVAGDRYRLDDDEASLEIQKTQGPECSRAHAARKVRRRYRSLTSQPPLPGSRARYRTR